MKHEVFTFKIAGKGGEGQQLAGLVLSRYFERGGYYVADNSEFPSRIKGGISTYAASLSGAHVDAPYENTDLLAVSSKEAFDYCLPNMKPGGLILYDLGKVNPSLKKTGNNKIYFGIPVGDIVSEMGLTSISSNFVMLGAVLYAMGRESGSFKNSLKNEFSNQQILHDNTTAFLAGYDFAKNNFIKKNICKIEAVMGVVGKNKGSSTFVSSSLGQNVSAKSGTISLLASRNKKIFINANEATALSAVSSGCTAYFAYPMSPATSILHYLAKWQKKTGMLIKQPQDEIEVVHLALGASFAGARSFIATSSGGMALMAEAISEAAMTETPLVIVNSQRTGPATGLPTWTEQGDLSFSENIGHGDFIRIILAPGDVSESFYMTSQAFNLSEKYQVPVIVLLDKYLSDGRRTVDSDLGKSIKIERGKIALDWKAKNGAFKRYEDTRDGVSARSFPGTKGCEHVANTDEHDEYGFSIEGFEPGVRVKQMKKRQKKLEGILSDLPRPILYGSKNAKITLVGWGSTKGPVLEAFKLLPKNKYNFLHFSAMAPLDGSRLKYMFSKKNKYYLVENNMTGQFGAMIKKYVSVDFDRKILKYNGSQFFPEEIVQRLGN